MKTKRIRTIFNTILCACICFMILGVDVLAAAPEDAFIPVSVELSGTLPKKEETFIICMQGENEETPMPEGSVDGIYSTEITGEDSTVLPIAEYDEVGVYNYVIWQEAGDNEKCTYDESVYKLKVTITNNETYDDYDVTVALREEGEDEKLDEIIFQNEYETVKPAKPKTGDTANMMLYITIMGIALVAVAGTAIYKRKFK